MKKLFTILKKNTFKSKTSKEKLWGNLPKQKIKIIIKIQENNWKMKKKYLNCNSKTIEFTKNKLKSFN